MALPAWYPWDEGEAMRLVTYGAVAAIALGSVLLGLDWLSAPMSPMADTEAGLRAAAPPRVAAPAPAVAPLPVAAPASPGATAQAVPSVPADAPQPAVRCNVNACATAYPHSFRATDCTYQPSNGPRRLCAK